MRITKFFLKDRNSDFNLTGNSQRIKRTRTKRTTDVGEWWESELVVWGLSTPHQDKRRKGKWRVPSSCLHGRLVYTGSLVRERVQEDSGLWRLVLTRSGNGLSDRHPTNPPMPPRFRRRLLLLQVWNSLHVPQRVPVDVRWSSFPNSSLYRIHNVCEINSWTVHSRGYWQVIVLRMTRSDKRWLYTPSTTVLTTSSRSPLLLLFVTFWKVRQVPV